MRMKIAEGQLDGFQTSFGLLGITRYDHIRLIDANNRVANIISVQALENVNSQLNSTIGSYVKIYYNSKFILGIEQNGYLYSDMDNFISRHKHAKKSAFKPFKISIICILIGAFLIYARLLTELGIAMIVLSIFLAIFGYFYFIFGAGAMILLFSPDRQFAAIHNEAKAKGLLGNV